VAAGDVMLGDSAICVGFGFHSRYPNDASPAFSRILPSLRRGEIVLANLECVLSRTGRGSSRYRADQMRGDPEYAQSLRAAGFTALAVANNHAMQHGLAGFEETVGHLRAVGIEPVGLRGGNGWCAAPVVTRTHAGLRVGILGYSLRPRQYEHGEPPYAEGNLDDIEKDIRRLRNTVDTLVVSLHWGQEFVSSPSAGEVGAAHRIIDAGASVIVGHHPHVVRPVERYRNGVICYSLGNLASDMLWQPELRRGAVLECKLSPGEVSHVSTSTVQIDDAYSPIPTAGRNQTDAVTGMPEAAYRAAVERALRLQRLAAYRYAARNIYRYPPAVVADLVASTARNKITGIFSRASDEADRARDPEVTSERAGPSRLLSILHIVAPARFGGLESVLLTLVTGLVRRHHTVRVALVLSPGDADHPLAAALEAEGASVVPIFVSDRDYLGERRAISALCKEHRPDIVHTHGYRPDVVDAMIARGQGSAVVSTCHGFIESSVRARLTQWIQRRALRRFDAVVAVSTPIERQLRRAGVPASKVHVVPNAFAPRTDLVGREMARKTLDLPDAPLIGWVGRLTSEKGPDVALEAFARLGSGEARLVMLGHGREADRLRSHAMSIGVSDRVIWRGAVPDAARFFRAFDVFLLSSRTEGTPIALFEAMAANVPIVATRVGGVPDVLDSSSALLVQSDDPEAIARALADVLSDKTGALHRAQLARKRLDERFAIDPWLIRHESIYTSIYRSRSNKG
jgi:poly-gamma-glutamate synthesis protein (capsule biosynthesis protein)